MKKAIQIIHDEHRSIAAVLSGLKELARLACDPSVQPDFAVFRAMLYYIDEFPERMHHPKEDLHLFARLLMRCPQAQALVGLLQAEHVTGAQLVRDLERALLAFEHTWPAGAERFAAAVEAYAQFHWSHMRREERDLLPLAEKWLTEEDWQVIEAAFAGNEDPIADLRDKDFRAVYQQIVNLAPAPVGLGERWKPAR